MTPKEKAEKIVNEFYKLSTPKDTLQEILIDQKLAKDSALLCLDIILQPFLIDYAITGHWKEVKQEIEKL